MATQPCVKCGANSMTWATDEELSPFTYWFCLECDETVAWEDESKERDCPECGRKGGSLYMWDRRSAFWYCVACTRKSPDSGPKPEWIET